MCLFKDFNGSSDLNQELLHIPPWITFAAGIDNLSCIFDNDAILFAHNKTACNFVNEVRDMDQAPSTLLLELLLPFCKPNKANQKWFDAQKMTHQAEVINSPA
jgi:hypothetical protein